MKNFDSDVSQNRSEQQDLGRRKLLKQIGLSSGAGILAVSGALPTQWMKPKLDSVLLPAHAQTTGPAPVACSGFVTSILTDNFGNMFQINGNNASAFSLMNGMVMAMTAPELVSFTAQTCNTAAGTAIDLDIAWVMAMLTAEMFTATTDATGLATFTGPMALPLSVVNAMMTSTATVTLSFNSGTPADTVTFNLDFTA